MDKRAVLEKILKAGQGQGRDILSSTSGPSWAARPNAMQPQLNESIKQWLEDDNSEPLKGIIAILQTTSALSAKEADDLLAAIEDNQGE